MNTSRKTDLDVAKGFLLFLVVFGHLVTMHHTVFRWIFAFHMPGFFFLSGMTFHPEHYPTLSSFLKKKARHLLLPYFCITLAALVICMIRPLYRELVLKYGWKYLALWVFYYGQPQNLYVGQIWFLPALFLAELLVWGWFHLLEGRTAQLKLFSVWALAVLAVNIRWLEGLAAAALHSPVDRLPWKMDTALCAAVFILAGCHAAKQELPRKLEPFSLFLIPCFIWLSFYFGPRLSTYVNICDCRYTEAPYYFAAAFCGIGAVLLTARRFSGSRFWQYCGRYSLPLFVSQTFAIYWVTEAIHALTGIDWIPSENMSNAASLLVAVLAFGLMLVITRPWILRQQRRQ